MLVQVLVASASDLIVFVFIRNYFCKSKSVNVILDICLESKKDKNGRHWLAEWKDTLWIRTIVLQKFCSSIFISKK